MALVRLKIYFMQRKFLSLFENQLLVGAKKNRLLFLFISNTKKKSGEKKSSAWISKSEPYNNKSNFLSFFLVHTKYGENIIFTRKYLQINFIHDRYGRIPEHTFIALYATFFHFPTFFSDIVRVILVNNAALKIEIMFTVHDSLTYLVHRFLSLFALFPH